MLTEKDLQQIALRGITPTQVDEQLNYFKTGFAFLPIDRAAVVGDGIKAYTAAEIDALIDRQKATIAEADLLKFVPASGAATRMFKELFEFVGDGKRSASVDEVLANVDKFAFADDLKGIAGDRETISAIIGYPLDYGIKPKALIKFHSYPDGGRTAFEEHLVEGASYAMSSGKVRIHFTVSPEHEVGFKELASRVLAGYSRCFGVAFDISYSGQKPSTDTIAADTAGEPFREADGSILFRPGGHGALLENLNDLTADIIFIKTVDNVCPDRLKHTTVTYKTVLASLLIELQQRIFGYLRLMDAGKLSAEKIAEIKQFIEKELCYQLSENCTEADLRAVLDRPTRVCGMVKNEGEPGGGPFWVRAADGTMSLQIAESSQISPSQKDLMKQATHFNPVDLVCAVKNYKGGKFDLLRYRDPSTGFISHKSKDGRELQAQELPGLWNGAMANWNTVFVEVPIATFSPVKTVNDLLRPQHQ